MKDRQVLVWDPLVRIGHWVIVAGLAIAYLTGDELLTPHVWAGYVVGIAVVVRVIWGFVGSKHARFADFLFGPSKVISHLFDVVRFRGKRYIGHGPVGSAMIFALFACLAATIVTGLAVYGAEKKAGPLRAWYADGMSAVQSPVVITTVAADEKREGGRERTGNREETMKEYHEVLANVTLGLVIIHIIGVLWTSFAHRENLVWAMVTGRKRSGERPSRAEKA